MHRWTTCAILAACAFSPCLQAHAQTQFRQEKLVIAGNSNIEATAINNHGTIVATVFDTNNNAQSGIALHRHTLTTLATPYSGAAAPMPFAINDQGDILGYAYEGIQPHMFLRRGGQYDPNADVTLVIEQQMGPPPLPIGLNRKDAVFYTIITGQSNPTDPIYGQLSKLHSMPYLLRYQTAHSLNASGMLAGTTFYGNASEVFVGQGKHFTELLPPGAKTAAGGFVNNAGAVAGAYTDSANTQHGFVYANGAYTSFDLPEEAAPYSVVVTGFNNAGRVVGVYESQATGKQHAFRFNGQTVTAFGNYSRADAVTVTLNDRGVMLVARQIDEQPGHYVSYRVTCGGTGC
jgi:hypothetical protein